MSKRIDFIDKITKRKIDAVDSIKEKSYEKFYNVYDIGNFSYIKFPVEDMFLKIYEFFKMKVIDEKKDNYIFNMEKIIIHYKYSNVYDYQNLIVKFEEKVDDFFNINNRYLRNFFKEAAIKYCVKKYELDLAKDKAEINQKCKEIWERKSTDFADLVKNYCKLEEFYIYTIYSFIFSFYFFTLIVDMQEKKGEDEERYFLNIEKIESSFMSFFKNVEDNLNSLLSFGDFFKNVKNRKYFLFFKENCFNQIL